MIAWTARILGVAAVAVLLAAPASAQDKIKCRMVYDVEGWAVFYESVKGTGRITCDNGQTLDVDIRAHAGGPALGTWRIVEGKGTFSSVYSVDDLYGTYFEATAHAGAGVGASARAMFKGNASLSLAGTGSGINLGIAIGGFSIRPR